MTSTDQIAENFLFSKMSGDSTLVGLLPVPPASVGQYNMFPDKAPAKVTFPVIIYQAISGSPHIMIGGGTDVAVGNHPFLIKVEGSTDAPKSLVWDIYNRIYTVLQNSSLSINDGFGNLTKVNCIITAPYQRVYNLGGKTYYQVGAYYLVTVRPPL